MAIELAVKSEDEITLPAGLATSQLTLSEIGAVAVLACLECQCDNYEALKQRLASPEMLAAIKRLKELGVLAAVVEGRTVTLQVKLDAIGL